MQFILGQYYRKTSFLIDNSNIELNIDGDYKFSCNTCQISNSLLLPSIRALYRSILLLVKLKLKQKLKYKSPKYLFDH